MTASRMYSFEVKRNPKKSKGVKLSALQNGYLTILIFSILIPKSQNFDFSKIKAYETKNFGVIPKTEYML